jgi:hypothetical protein
MKVAKGQAQGFCHLLSGFVARIIFDDVFGFVEEGELEMTAVLQHHWPNHTFLPAVRLTALLSAQAGFDEILGQNRCS